MERDKTYDMTEYITFCIGQFAAQHGLEKQSAYAYLRRYGAIDFLIKCYEAEHTLSIENALEDMKEICLKNGGQVA